jgi:hypothetical protein
MEEKVKIQEAVSRKSPLLRFGKGRDQVIPRNIENRAMRG